MAMLVLALYWVSPVLASTADPSAEPCQIPLSTKNAASAPAGGGAAKEKTVKLKTPQCYAHQLGLLTLSYLTSLERQVTAQEKTYNALAAVSVSADHEDTGLGLDIARDTQIQVWISHLVDGATTPNGIVEDLGRLGKGELDATQSEEQQALDGKAAYLATLTSISADTSKVATLVTLFNDMATPNSLSTTLSDLTAYGQATQTQLAQASCALAKSRLSFLQAESSQLATSAAKAGISAAQKASYVSQKSAVDQEVTTSQKQANACTTAPAAK
jgi:hypothetical protein